MISPDDAILMGFSFRELTLHMAVPAFLLGLAVWRKVRYKYWDWLSITLGIILLSPWPLIMFFHWYVWR